jgi:hypothetical protein
VARGAALARYFRKYGTWIASCEMKTAEQSEQDRAAAREALRRHRARRKAEKDALPRWQTRAVDDINAVLRDVLFGGSGEIQTRDRTDALAAALFDALGPEAAVRLAAQLTEEINAGGTRAQRRRELDARDGSDAVEAGGEICSVGADGKEPARTLDKSRDYGIVCGDARGIAFEQDGILFRADGTEAGCE